jgi:hypothetical protein
MARMQPNDLPILCLPLELSDEAAAQLIEFLEELTDRLHEHYAAQLLRHSRARAREERSGHCPGTSEDRDPPF